MAGKIQAPGEFELIARLFAPLAAGYAGAYGLTDDVAYLGLPGAAGGLLQPDEELIVKTDALVAGVHFLVDDPADLVARKLLRVNLSDLAAKGARPLIYTLAAMLPHTVDYAWLERFAAGLATDQAEYGAMLVGGDLDATPGPAAFSLTILGAIPPGRRLLRSAAEPGDAIFVSGTLGDGALGLLALRGELRLEEADSAYLIERYRLPRPRLALGARLLDIAHASMDISDGLAADLGHICQASGLAARVEAARIPLSPAARRAVAQDAALFELALAGGDDYELLFTAPPEAEERLAAIARELDIRVTRIGAMRAGEGVQLRDERGREIRLERAGYSHF
jgi:thiamine-monophosphate kinase